jgi:hypothetical protein
MKEHYLTKMKIQLEHSELPEQPAPEDIAKTLLSRFGLLPRKKDGNAQMHKLLIELSERKKSANRDKKPELAVMPVEEMGSFAGIKRQTMYEYLHRWLELNVLKKTSFVSNSRVVIGYELNGTNLEAAFRKAESTIKTHLEDSFKLIELLQNEIKREKLKAAAPEQESSLSTANSGQ